MTNLRYLILIIFTFFTLNSLADDPCMKLTNNNSMGKGSFAKTCKECKLNSKGNLTAKCQVNWNIQNPEEYKQSSILIGTCMGDVLNDDGILKCDSLKYKEGQFLKSCVITNLENNNTRITANCHIYGPYMWKISSIDLEKCKVGDLVDDEFFDVLTCMNTDGTRLRGEY